MDYCGRGLGVAAVAAVASYEHAYDLVRMHGESGLGHGLIGAGVAAWPAVALAGSYELLMMVIRSSQVPAQDKPDSGHEADPLREQAAGLFAEQLAVDRVPSIRAIRAQLHVRQPRAQRLLAYPATGTARQAESSAASATCGEDMKPSAEA